MTTTLLTFIINEALQYGPSVITEIESLFASGTPTLADLQTLRAKIEAESYALFVPASAINANPPATAPAPAALPANVMTLVQPPVVDLPASTAALPPVVGTVPPVTPPPVEPMCPLTLTQWINAGGEVSGYPPLGMSVNPPVSAV